MSKPPAITSILCIPERLSYTVNDRLEQYASFTTITDAEPTNVVSRGVALICLHEWGGGDLKLTHIGILQKQQRVATGQVRVKCLDAIEIKGVEIEDLIAALPKHLQIYAKRAFLESYTKVSEKLGEALLETLLIFVPEQGDKIDVLFEKIKLPNPLQRSERETDAAAERDAVGIALDIFGVQRSNILRRWDQNKGLGETFLRGFEEYTSYEDDIIGYDLHTLPGWSAIKESITGGVVEFENINRKKLTIINANRKPTEKATGVDLIYFHRKYEAFTCVQYKMMDQKDSKNNMYYNPNQSSHNEELGRMKDLRELLNREEKGESLKDYRFSDCPIFFKLCKKLEVKNNEGKIAPGAYIPLDQWERLLTDPSTLGKRDGRQIGYHTLNGRYLRTQTFVDIVQYGMIGTQADGSAKLARFVESAIEEGISVIYAIDRRTLKLPSAESDEEDADIEK